MRQSGTILAVFFVLFSGVSGCGEKPIGQPCTFTFPTKDDQTGPDCVAMPTCHPLQEGIMAASPTNNACPIDCIQMPSLECENLICVATQIEGNFANMNGRCAGDIPRMDCPNTAWGCSGYCTKECLTNASCPRGYQCSAMAPFGQTLNCANEAQWGGNPLDPNQPACTTNCIKAGQPTPKGGVCPSSSPPDYSNCGKADYARCCSCICYQFCPILAKKFCRKETWDQKMFGTSTTSNPNCGGQ